MEFQQIRDIAQKINPNFCIEYGCIGTGYQYVLLVQDGKIKEVGEFVYRIHRENKATSEQWEEFFIRCQQFVDGELNSMPQWFDF